MTKVVAVVSESLGTVPTDGSLSSQQRSHFPLFPSVRLFITVLLFLFLVVANASLSVINFTIVCMLKSTALDNGSTITNASIIDEIDDKVLRQYEGDLNWSRSDVGNVLAAYNWGIFVSMFAGFLFDKYGAKRLFTVVFAVNSLLLFLTPVVAYQGPWWVFVVRFIEGIFGGLVWPGVLPVATHWAPLSEHGTVVGVSQSGAPLGHLLDFVTSGLFCSLGPGQWIMSYVLWGTLSAVLTVACIFLYSDEPQNHRFISDAEKKYIIGNRSLQKNSKEKIDYGPMILGMLSSARFYAIVAANMVHGWTFFTVVGLTPMYLKEVIKLDPAKNGLFAALPPLAQFFGLQVFGQISDRISRRWPDLSSTLLSKVFEGVSCLLPAALFIAIANLNENSQFLSVPLICACYFFEGAGVGGNVRSSLSIAPSIVGVIACVAQGTFGATATAVPYVFAALVKNGTADEWRLVFYTSAGVALAGYLVFLMFGSAVEQSWAKQSKSHLAKLENSI